MARMTDAEKAERKRDRMIEKAHEKKIGTYVAKFVAPVFQKMIRAEAGAQPAGQSPSVVMGEMTWSLRLVGSCVCVTCGKVEPWSRGLSGMHTGHFLAGRGFSIVFEEDNVAPQCSRCNRYLGGSPQEFRLWMSEVRGENSVQRLRRLKGTIRKFTREELVDMRIEYEARLKAAIERMS
jgi:hypothetical protein